MKRFNYRLDNLTFPHSKEALYILSYKSQRHLGFEDAYILLVKDIARIVYSSWS